MKKIVSLLAVSALALGVLTGCNGGNSSTAADKSGALSNDGEKTVVKIGATATPHAEILAEIKDDLAAKGIELEIIEYADYQQINPALASKDIDANYFQHQPFLDTYNSEKGDELESIAVIHYEPFGIYPGKVDKIENLEEGSEILVPNDTTNGARALLLLEQEGIIKLKEGAELNATVNDIVENPKNVKIVEVDAAQIPRSLPDAAMAAINGNYALQAGFKVSEALAVEASDSIAAKTFGNVIAVRPEDKDNANIKAVVDALKSDKVKKFIEEKYEGGVVALF